jgi:DNA-binding transcriptional regulator WhiA
MNEKSLAAIMARNADRAKAAGQRDAAAAELALAVGTINPAHEMALRLRIAHPSESMATLAAMCTPPISKDRFSGILRRALNKRPTRAGDRDE